MSGKPHLLSDLDEIQ